MDHASDDHLSAGAAGLARQCQIQVAYAIGVARPMNVTVYTEGIRRKERTARVAVFDLGNWQQVAIRVRG